MLINIIKREFLIYLKVVIPKIIMKKLILSLSFIVASNMFSQETDKSVATTSTPETNKSSIFGRKNEIKLDLIYLIFRPALNLSFERLLTTESGVGATIVFAPDDNTQSGNTTFSFTPYYRYYFGKKPASGFFFEGFAAINTFRFKSSNVESYYDNNGYYQYNYENIDKKVTDLAVGVGLGGKWVTSNGIVFELSTGVGRNLLNKYSNNNNVESIYKIFVRGGISIGYRF